jgi:allantoate deiminase
VSPAPDFAEHALKVLNRCDGLARCTEDPPRIQRTFLSAQMRACYNEVEAWMQTAGMKTYLDAGGNLRGLYPGATANAPKLLLGSHLDTVPNAGRYDGILGVVLALSLIELLDKQPLSFAIELLAFSEEEGIRFGTPFIGSRAVVGALDETALDRRDTNNISIREAISKFGLDPSKILDAAIKPSDNALGYLEFHIEQGPVLEHLNLPLAIVDAIVGHSRFELHFAGAANHAGTTPMNLRRDALVAAAEFVVGVEKHAIAVPGLVATIGILEPKPGAINVIAGECRATLDLRHPDNARRETSAQTLHRLANEIAVSRSVTLSIKTTLEQSAVPMDAYLISQLESAFAKSNLTPHRMPSGAGHDAQILAPHTPSAMVFLRTPGGISHNPAESVLVGDVEKALECGLTLLHQLATSSEFLSRTRRA